ncbi:MAG TPA: cupin domain-containing protein [Solirubrobacteraceae bacterium]
MGIAHFDEARVREFEVGHIGGRWTFVGEAAGCVTVGVRRMELPAGGWSTPAHEHGVEEEIFYVLGGRGLSWQNGKTAEVGPGDCIVYLANGGAHTLHALEPLDVLVFGPRVHTEVIGLPRLELSIVGNRAVESVPGYVGGTPVQFIREAELGPPELPESPGPRPGTIVNVETVEPRPVERSRVVRTRRDVATAAGSISTGLQHVQVAPGKESGLLHCHSLEEEIFVMLKGDGVLVLDDREETPVRPGHVVARPAGTGVAHLFRAGDAGLTYLAYGTREPADICYYPRSNKISFRGVRVIARLERLDYWDGED